MVDQFSLFNQKMPNIHWIQLLSCEHLLIFFAINCLPSAAFAFVTDSTANFDILITEFTTFWYFILKAICTSSV